MIDITINPIFFESKKTFKDESKNVILLSNNYKLLEKYSISFFPDGKVNADIIPIVYNEDLNLESKNINKNEDDQFQTLGLQQQNSNGEYINNNLISLLGDNVFLYSGSYEIVYDTEDDTRLDITMNLINIKNISPDSEIKKIENSGEDIQKNIINNFSFIVNKKSGNFGFSYSNRIVHDLNFLYEHFKSSDYYHIYSKFKNVFNNASDMEIYENLKLHNGNIKEYLKELYPEINFDEKLNFIYSKYEPYKNHRDIMYEVLFRKSKKPEFLKHDLLLYIAQDNGNISTAYEKFDLFYANYKKHVLKNEQKNDEKIFEDYIEIYAHIPKNSTIDDNIFFEFYDKNNSK